MKWHFTRQHTGGKRTIRRFLPRMERLEDRTLLSTIAWTNRGSSDPIQSNFDSDLLNTIFADKADQARAVIDAALLAWQNAIERFNYSDNTDTLSVKILGDPATSGTGAVTVVDTSFDADSAGRPKEGEIDLNAGADGHGSGWYLDPSPNDSREFRGDLINACAANATPGSEAAKGDDLFTVVVAEMAHVLGLNRNPDLLFQNSPNLSPTNQDDAIFPGKLFTYTGTVQALFTTNNGGPESHGGKDTTKPLHIAEPVPGNIVAGGYYGAQDSDNAGYEVGRRYLPSLLDAIILQDVYGYTLTSQTLFATSYANFDPGTGNLLVRGGQAEEQINGQPIYPFDGAHSDDRITLRRVTVDGVDRLEVGTIIGNPIPGTATNTFYNGQPAQLFDALIPFDLVKTITIVPGEGDDNISLDLSGGTVIPTGGITIGVPPAGGSIAGPEGGNDTLEIIGSLLDSDYVVLDHDDSTGLDTVAVDGSTSVVAYQEIENVTVQTYGGEDVIDVEGASGYAAVTLDAGQDDDRFYFSQHGGNLDRVVTVTPMIVDGGPGFDDVVINDYYNGHESNEYRFLLGGPGMPDFTRNSSLALNLEVEHSLELNTTLFDDQVFVEGTIPDMPTKINTGPGSDTVVVDSNMSNPGGTVNFVSSQLNIDGDFTPISYIDLGVQYHDHLVVTDLSDIASNTVNVTGTTISNDPLCAAHCFFGFHGGISYQGLDDLQIDMGGASERGVSGNTVNVRGTAAGAMTTIHTGQGPDTILVSAPTLMGEGPTGGGGASVNGILSRLDIYGQEGLDRLTVDDSAETNDTTATLVAGGLGEFPGDNLFGLGGELFYDSIAELNLLTGVGNDTINVLRTPVETAVTVKSGAGSDTFFVGSPTYGLEGIAGMLTVNGQSQPPAGRDVMSLLDDGASAGQNYVVTATTVERSGAAQITYGGLETLAVDSGAFDDHFSVLSTAAATPVTLNEGDGGDTTDIGNLAGVLDDFLSRVMVGGQAGSDVLHIHDAATTMGMGYTLKPTTTVSTVDRTGAATIAYSALEGVVFDAGDHDDIFTVIGNLSGTTPLLLHAGAGADTLHGPDTVNTWSLHLSNGGTLNNTIAFLQTENLQGGSQTDQFQFENGAGLTGFIAGGGERDTLDYSVYTTTITVALTNGAATGAAGGVSGIENVTGGVKDDLLIGDPAANTLDGGPGNDILVGNSGIDRLLGGAGRDILIGGAGPDNLSGGAGDDILIGGTTSFDAQLVALKMLLAEWTRTSVDYNHRIIHLRSGGGLNGPFLLKASTVFDDHAVDTLLGGDDQDWFWSRVALPKDSLPGRKPTERVN